MPAEPASLPYSQFAGDKVPAAESGAQAPPYSLSASALRQWNAQAKKSNAFTALEAAPPRTPVAAYAAALAGGLLATLVLVILVTRRGRRKR
mgnify:CR=1 FL=1